MIKRKKILGIFGNVANAGQERANCDVYALLNKHYTLKVLVNKRGFHWHLQPFFEKQGISFDRITFPWEMSFGKSMREILQWVGDIIQNNIEFIKIYRKYKPDYIHIGNEYMFRTLIIPLLCCRAKINFRLGDRPFIKRFYNRLFWKLISKRVNIFVCDTNFILGLLHNAGRSCKALDIVLYHPAPLRSPSTLFKNDRNDDIIRIGYIGQINHSKGVDILLKSAIEICKNNEKVEFFFAGNIDNNLFYDKILSQMTADLSLSIRNRIRFVGQIEDANGFFDSLSIHVAPSVHEEPYGLVMVEAKQNHKASIIFPSGGMPELIEHGKTGYICSEKTSEALVEAIEYYVQHPEEIKKQGAAAYNSLKQLNISVEHFSSVWLKVYSE